MDQYTIGDGNVQRGTSSGLALEGRPHEGVLEQSPITAAPRIKAPTLVLSNTGDSRVPITQSFQLYRALKDNGVKTKFIAYPLSGHSPEDPVHQSDVDRRYVEWFREYLR